MTTPAMPAARVGDPFKHRSFMAALAGAAAGAIIEFGVISACGFFLGGIGGFAAAMVLLNTPVVSSTIDKVKSAVENFFESDDPDGFIIKGSINVSVNKRKLAYATPSNAKDQTPTIKCDNHGPKTSPKVVKVCLSTDSLLLEKEMAQNVVQKLVMVLLMSILVQDKALMQRWSLNLISFRD